MTHPARVKGNKAEVAVRDYLRTHGFPGCERIPAGAREDRGDLSSVPRSVVQVKSYADIARACREGVADAEAQRAAAGAEFAFVIVKRPGRSDPGEWYLVQRLAQGARLMPGCEVVA